MIVTVSMNVYDGQGLGLCCGLVAVYLVELGKSALI